MIVMFEGVDKSGKTFAIDKVRKRINNIILKSYHVPKGSDDLDLKSAYYDILSMLKVLPINRLVILDRWYPSQMVYSILRGHDSFEDTWYKVFDRVVATELPILIVKCKTPYNVIIDRHKQENDDYIKLKDVDVLMHRYEKFFSITECPFIEIDTLDIHAIDRIIAEINKMTIKYATVHLDRSEDE